MHFLIFTKNWWDAVGARATDAALIGSGFAAAAGSIVFAGAMLMQSEHAPPINGLEYLAIFAKPHGASQSAAPAPKPTQALDMTPVGAISPSPPVALDGFALVAAQWDFAWVREGSRIFAVRPGDDVPRLGHVNAILFRQGRWILFGEAGKALLTSDGDAGVQKRPPFARQMIFNGEK